MSVLLLTMGPQLGITADLPVVGLGGAGVIRFRPIGASGPVKWTLVDSTLPAEWDSALNPDGDAVTLTTSDAETAGTFRVAVRAVDSARIPVVRSFDVRVMALPMILSGSFPDWAVGQPVSGALTISGGAPPYIGPTITSGALPAGVTLAIVGNQIVPSGMPTAIEAWNATVQISDNDSAIVSISVGGQTTWPEFVQLSGSGSLYVPAGVFDLLLVAGGGGGGSRQGGGGGAGGVLLIENHELSAGTYSYTVGAGGIGGSSGGRGQSGQNSVFGAWAAIGGGGGGGRTSNHEGLDGGSGGGSARNYSHAPGIGTDGQGYGGGRASNSLTDGNVGGGGGGAGGVGGDGTGRNGTGVGGDGGNGRYIASYSAYGVGGYFGGGGGGGVAQTEPGAVPGTGGVGGGGGGAAPSATPQAGTSGLDGTGGGGGGSNVLSADGGDGGSGTVILRRVS